MTSRPAALPGFSSPAAGFDEPMAMLEACHDRIRRSLDLLGRLCQRVAQGRVDAAVHAAAADVLRYFDRAAPHHHEDEERHIFPCVLAHGAEPALVQQLQEDHRAMNALWAQLREPLAALAAGEAAAFGAAQIETAQQFIEMYAAHAKTEEALVFPAARAALGEDALRRIGAEMASRRGV